MIPNEELTVEAVAQHLGITARTLHYYEEMGLIEPTCRTAGGHRLYDEQVVRRLEHIMRLKENLGYSLSEIRHLLDVETSLDGIRASLNNRDVSVDVRLRQLEEAKRSLQGLLSQIDGKLENLKSMQKRYQERLNRTETLLERLESQAVTTNEGK